MSEHRFVQHEWNNPAYEKMANELCNETRLLMLDGYVGAYEAMEGLTYERKFAMAIRHWVQNAAVDLDNNNSEFEKELKVIEDQKTENAVNEERLYK